MSSDDELIAEASRLARAEQLLGHPFSDRRRLLSALTHRSFHNERASDLPDNEVLELLGDAVLSLIVTEVLVHTSPTASEGELTERRAAHVSTANLAQAAGACGLVSLLRTGRSLARGIPENAAADVVEAVLGACYLDGGLSVARAVVLRLLGPPPVVAAVARTNAKKELQERLQALVGFAPSYVVTHKEGPRHAPVYVAEVVLGTRVLGRGEGGNKRTASEAAAADALAALGDVDDATLATRLRASGLPPGRA